MALSLDDSRRPVLAQWLFTNGFDPHDVPLDADLTIIDTEQGRAIRCEVFFRNEEGAKVIDERGEREARQIITLPLKTEPPKWWTPYEKPTREQLLAAVERVRKLHAEEFGCCSHCTCEDSVLYPCPTIRALDGEEQP